MRLLGRATRFELRRSDPQAAESLLLRIPLSSRAFLVIGSEDRHEADFAILHAKVPGRGTFAWA